MGQTDRPDDRRAAGSRLPSNSESAVKRNHETPKSGIQKRKKIEACPRLSCKIQYLLASNHRDQSTTSEYFTDDHVKMRNFVEATRHVESSGELIGERLVVDKIVGARGADRLLVKAHRINVVALEASNLCADQRGAVLKIVRAIRRPLLELFIMHRKSLDVLLLPLCGWRGITIGGSG